MCPQTREASGDSGGGGGGGGGGGSSGLGRVNRNRGATSGESDPSPLPNRFARMDRKVAIMGVRPTARYRRSSAGASGSAQSPIAVHNDVSGQAAGPEIIDLEAEVGSQAIGGAGKSSNSLLERGSSSRGLEEGPLPKRHRSSRSDGSPAATRVSAGRLGGIHRAPWARGPWQQPSGRGVRPIDVDSVVEVEAARERSLQVSEDERLARQLQEEFSSEATASGRDADLARSLQEQEQRHAINLGNYQRLQAIYRSLQARIQQGPLNARIQQASSSMEAANRQRSRVLGRFQERFGAMLRRRIPLAMQLAYVDRDFNENDYETLLALDDGVKQRGASQTTIDTLPVAEAVEADKSEPCAICLEVPVGGEQIRRLPCLHGFHKQCIDTWLQRRANCPVCKASV